MDEAQLRRLAETPAGKTLEAELEGIAALGLDDLRSLWLKMTQNNILIVDGHAWRRLGELRNVQLEAWRKAANRRNRSERHDQRAMERRP
jgi:hypothetical protein